MNKEQYDNYLLRRKDDIIFASENSNTINIDAADFQASIFFLQDERNRLIQKLEAIENLSRLAWGRAREAPEEVESIIRQINFHSK